MRSTLAKDPKGVRLSSLTPPHSPRTTKEKKAHKESGVLEKSRAKELHETSAWVLCAGRRSHWAGGPEITELSLLPPRPISLRRSSNFTRHRTPHWSFPTPTFAATNHNVHIPDDVTVKSHGCHFRSRKPNCWISFTKFVSSK